MQTKKKFIIAIVVLAIALLAAVGVTIGVLAAANATITSNVNVTYQATDVAFTASATWKVGAEGTENNMTTDGTASGATTVTIDGTETTATGSLSPIGNIELTKQNQFVVFKYTITNTGSKAIDGALTIPATQTNVNVQYSTDGTTYSNTNSGISNLTTGNTANYYVKVSIVNIANDSEFSGSFSWAMTVHA